ncbi:SGNH/GDSL hydrolase family protein [Actinoplanes sp. N902-109]|uniref:SGNH/GDSL hydrolase family protein n=1 Tax=Actinoplanes sp. (strain N902-109) TaxID=649831 RepID=UPI00032939D3|nr:SGNH/GDSL hydrolase family protein [Actinoplanes sp. N902-109]AGL17374.1 GDSL family lipase [Actinoplanes sp. N902-109]
MKRRSLLGAAAVLPLGAGAAARPGPAPWIPTWVAMPQLTEPANLPPLPLVQVTLRQTVHTSTAGSGLRVRFSNAFGGTALPIAAVSVARPLGGQAGVAAIEPGSSRPVTFAGRPFVTVPVGAQAVSDPVPFDVPARSNLTVTVYLAAGQDSPAITSHPGSRTTSYLLPGDHHDDPDLPGATAVDHWYLLSGVEVRAAGTATVILGDSLTDGRGSTTNANNRWPDQLAARFPRTPAILNQAAGGNRVLQDGLGPSVLARLDRDVLALGRTGRVILFEGVNDIGTAPATAADQQAVGDELLAAYQQIVVRCQARELPVAGATITPFGGNTGYDDPGGLREATRQRVNQQIRSGRLFDAVLDFDAAVRDPGDPRRLWPAYDTGDHLHLTPDGYRAIAAAVPLRLLR